MNVFHQLLLKLVNTVSPRDSLMPVFTEQKKQQKLPVKEINNTLKPLASITTPKPSEACKTKASELEMSEEENQPQPSSPKNTKPKVTFEDIAIFYNLPESPYQQALQQAVYTIYCQYSDKYNALPIEIENALYFGFKRYLCHRQYTQNDEDYLNGLLGDVEQGKRHYNEACFYDRGAEDVFRSIKHALVALTVQHKNNSN